MWIQIQYLYKSHICIWLQSNCWASGECPDILLLIQLKCDLNISCNIRTWDIVYQIKWAKYFFLLNTDEHWEFLRTVTINAQIKRLLAQCDILLSIISNKSVERNHWIYIFLCVCYGRALESECLYLSIAF